MPKSKRTPAEQTILLDKILSHLREQGGRMTETRHEILEAMIKLTHPKTAYQILDEINKKRKTTLSAMSLYRTLDFLIEAGVVLKVESRNMYELCFKDTPDHSHLVMICDKCGSLQEIEDPALEKKLTQAAKKRGLELRHHVIELHGICKTC